MKVFLKKKKAHSAKVLKRFNMDKSYQLTIPMIVRSLDVNKDFFWSRKSDEELIGLEIPS